MTLTGAGHAVVERTVDAVLGREAQLVDGLTEAERAALAGLLDRLLSEVAGRSARRRRSRSQIRAGRVRVPPDERPGYAV